MNRHIVLTGATGTIGLPLAARLLSGPSTERLTAIVRNAHDVATLPTAIKNQAPSADTTRLKVVVGEASHPGWGLDDRIEGPTVTAVIHSAAFTKFKDTEDSWRQINVLGTKNLLQWREMRCPDSQLIHFSTLCAAGKSLGSIAEAPLERPEGFVNGYEASKWEAEQLVQQACGPVTILRLATVVGSLADGGLPRTGAFHHVLRWVYRGLLPLIPGEARSGIDLIPTEYVTEGVCQLLDSPASTSPVFHHFSRGESIIELGALIDVCAARFARESDAWRRGRIAAPVTASSAVFEEFRRSVLASRDLLFTQILESVDSFLPELFFPKQFATTSVMSLFEGRPPLGEWRTWIDRVLDFSLRSDFGRNP